jgi:uncharacterized repeat protein (TIGR01451 family)
MKRKTLAIVMAAIMVLTMVTPTLASPPNPDGAAPPLKPQEVRADKWELVAADSSTIIDMTEPAIYIIKLEDAALASYRGGVAGLRATNPEARGEAKLDTKSADSVTYLSYLEDKQTQFIVAMEQAVARPVNVKFQYKYASNGMAVWLTPQEAAKVATLPGVVHVERDTMLYPTTDVGPAWIGAEGIWDGTATGGLPATKGEGVIVGILDSGINMDHPSFAATGDDGYVHTNPFGAGTYVGLCATEPATYTCNSKLIGAWDFTDEDPLDDEDAAHGSHTASTAAGNVVYSPTVHAPTTAITFTEISGVAPHANIIAYDVCTEDGCPNSATSAAKDQAIADGVDVINYSIGGGPGNPWTGTGAQEWLVVRDAGIFVATSAGNSGPDAETIGSPGNSPWMLTVGASSHNRVLINKLIVISDTTVITIEGEGLTGGYGPAPIVYAGTISPTNPGCDLAFAPGTFSGEIVVCEHDPNGPNYVSRVNKSEMVRDAGGGGFIMVTDADYGVALMVDSYAVPGMGVTNADGEMVKTGIASGAIQIATISGVAAEPARGDVMAGFSSRGPNPDATLASSVLKPDVTAPGRRILAAVAVTDPDPGDPPEYDVYQGTSMSSPHAAGAGALLRALHPDWTPAEIQSALMAAALSVGTLKEDGVTPADPFDIGAGRIDLSGAAQVGLVLDETTANFEDADPAEGGDPATLNLASLGNGECLQNCTWERTFRNALEVPTTYTATVDAPTGLTVTVDPPTFTVPAGGMQVVAVTADVSAMPIDEWQFAEVGFETDGMHPEFTAVLGEEGFDGATYPPTGWGVYMTGDSADPGWITTTDAYVSAPYAVAHYDDDLATDAESWLVTPQFTPTVQTELAFWQLTYWDPYYWYHGIWVSDGSGDPNNGDFVELVELDVGTGGSWEKVFQSLSAYAGTPIYVAFRYDGDYADWWFVDDVEVRDVSYTTAEVSDLHMPMAVRPTTGRLPETVEISTRRNAGSYLVEDLQALEITDLTIDYYGFAEGDLLDFQLYEDPTNDIPSGFFDDLDQVFWMTMTVEATDMRLVAEILDTTSPDLDMAVGRDVDGDGPEVDEIVCQSATGTAYEACDVSGADLVAGEWWVIVLNWAESASPPDDVTMAVALVGADSGNMTVTGPSTVAKKTDFDLRVFWDIPTMEGGDRWYGAFAIGSDAAHAGNVGTIPVDIVRYPDDVSKMVTTPAWVGDVVDYTISIMPDVTGEDLTYFITDTIPAGLTYVPDSASASSGVVTVTGNTLTWTGQALGVRRYYASTSETDPNCGNLLDGSPTYFDWYANYGWTTDSGLSGDDLVWGYGGPAFSNMSFYGQIKPGGVRFTDDGYAKFLGDADYSSVHQNIPDPTVPNELMAPFWFDFEIVYDATENRGITTGSGGTFFMVEYDDVEPAPAGSTNFRLDFEMMMDGAVNDAPGSYEIAFAYDNISGTLDTGTIGVENATGMEAVNVGYNNISTIITDDLVICFDWALAPEPVEITYEAVVSVDYTGDTIENTVLHNTDNLGSEEGSASATLTVERPVPMWEKMVYVNDALAGTFPVDVAAGDTIEIVDMVWITSTKDVTFNLMEEWSDSLELLSYGVRGLPGGTAILPDYGTVVLPATGAMTVTVTDGPSDWGYVITKTFNVLAGTWETNTITESLWVEDAYPQFDDVVLEFTHQHPDIDVAPTSFDVTLKPDGTSTDTLTISNLGDFALDWNMAMTPTMTWLSFDPVSGTIAEAGSTDVMLTFDATGLVSVTQTTMLQITSDDPDESPVNVPVSLTVGRAYIYLPLVMRNSSGTVGQSG